MFKNFLVCISLIIFCNPVYSKDQYSDEILMEAFTWDVKPGLWKTLISEIPEIKETGITSLWIPPAYKSWVGQASVGYDVYDLYDFGEYNQKGTVATRHGTKQDLLNLIDLAHKNQIKIYEDIVLNHLIGGDPEIIDGKTYYTKFTYPHKKWERDHNDFILTSDLEKKLTGKAYCYSWGAKVNYDNPRDFNEMLKWSDYINQTYHFDGYRMDAVKCVDEKVIKAFAEKNKDKFIVGEAWDNRVSLEEHYKIAFDGMVKMLDFPLYNVLKNMSKYDSFNMNALNKAGFVAIEPDYAVTFVENHDSGRDNPLTKRLNMAYAYILTHEGIPCIFYRDFENQDLRKELNLLINFRKTHNHGKVIPLYLSNDIYSMYRDDFIFILNHSSSTIGIDPVTPFKNKTLRNIKTKELIKTDKNGKLLNKLSTNSNDYSIWEVLN